MKFITEQKKSFQKLILLGFLEIIQVRNSQQLSQLQGN